jgi:hypothetical protein
MDLSRGLGDVYKRQIYPTPRKFLATGHPEGSVRYFLGQLAAPFTPPEFRHQRNRDNKKPAHMARALC